MTFDLAEVRAFIADLTTRADCCDRGECADCMTLDDGLRHFATLCRQMREGIRGWAMAVFEGRLAFDAEAERVWRGEAERLLSRSALLLPRDGRATCGECVDGQTILKAALWDLSELFRPWVTPKLAVGPSARVRYTLTPEQVAEVRRLHEALPPADPLPPEVRQPLARRR